MASLSIGCRDRSRDTGSGLRLKGGGGLEQAWPLERRTRL